MPGGRTELPGHADLLHGDVPAAVGAATSRRSTPSTARRASSSTTRSAGRNWTFNAGLLLSNDSLYGQDLRTTTRRRSPASSLRSAGRHAVQDVRDPVQQDGAAAPRRHLGLQRLGHRLRQLREVQPGGQLAAARRLVGPQPARPRSTRTSTPTACSSATTAVASSSGKLFVEDLTPRTVNEVLFGTARQFSSRWSAALYGRYREGSHFWEDTNNTAASRPRYNPPAGIPRELYIPNLSDSSRRSAAARRYVIAELDGALHEVSTRSRSRPSGATARRSSAARTPGATTTATSTRTTRRRQRRQRLHRLVVHRRRRRPPALGLPRRRSARRPAPHAEGLRLLRTGFSGRPFHWNATAGAFIVAQSGQPWETWSYEPYRALTTRVATRPGSPSRPARGARQRTPSST